MLNRKTPLNCHFCNWHGAISLHKAPSAQARAIPNPLRATGDVMMITTVVRQNAIQPNAGSSMSMSSGIAKQPAPTASPVVRAFAEIAWAFASGQKEKTDRPFSVATLADHWGCFGSCIYDMIRSGKLEAFKRGETLYRIPASEVARIDASRVANIRQQTGRGPFKQKNRRFCSYFSAHEHEGPKAQGSVIGAAKTTL